MSLLEERCSYIQHVEQNQEVPDSAWLGPSSKDDFPFLFMAANICNTAKMLLDYPTGKGMGSYSMKTFDSLCFPAYLCVYVMRRWGGALSILFLLSGRSGLSFSPPLSSCRFFFSLLFAVSLCDVFTSW